MVVVVVVVVSPPTPLPSACESFCLTSYTRNTIDTTYFHRHSVTIEPINRVDHLSAVTVERAGPRHEFQTLRV